MQLASCNREGRLHIDESAAAWLRSLSQSPLGVMAVVGPQRSGKSSLLNDLFRGSGEFRTSANVASCTKGLWAKAVPAPPWCPALDGGWLLLLDT